MKSILSKLGVVRNECDPYWFFVVYPLQDGADQEDHPPRVREFIQAGGAAARMTVEVKLPVEGGYRMDTVGRPGAAEESECSESVAIVDPDKPLMLLPSEVLNWREALELFEYFYDHTAIAPGWHERPTLRWDEDGVPLE